MAHLRLSPKPAEGRVGVNITDSQDYAINANAAPFSLHHASKITTEHHKSTASSLETGGGLGGGGGFSGLQCDLWDLTHGTLVSTQMIVHRKIVGLVLYEQKPKRTSRNRHCNGEAMRVIAEALWVYAKSSSETFGIDVSEADVQRFKVRCATQPSRRTKMKRTSSVGSEL